jgi:hypothetical protein
MGSRSTRITKRFFSKSIANLACWANGRNNIQRWDPPLKWAQWETISFSTLPVQNGMDTCLNTPFASLSYDLRMHLSAFSFISVAEKELSPAAQGKLLWHESRANAGDHNRGFYNTGLGCACQHTQPPEPWCINEHGNCNHIKQHFTTVMKYRSQLVIPLRRALDNYQVCPSTQHLTV